MKKIFVISNTSFSIEKFRSHYLSKIKDFNFTIYTPNEIPHFTKKYKNIELKKFTSKNILDDFKNLYKIFEKENPEVIIVYSFKYQLIASVLKKIFNFQYDILSIIAGLGSLHLSNIFNRIFFYSIVKIIIAMSKFIICINPDDLNYFKQIIKNENKIFLIPTEGVEKIKKTKKIFKNNKNFIFFARLIKEKGIIDYIKTAIIIKKKYPEANFYIAGPSKQSIIGQSKFDQKTLEFIKKNKKNVIFLDYIKNYKKIFPKMGCLISPSYSEGAGTSVMEAMLSGLFVIAYSNNGHKYVLKNTSNIICEENNIQNLVTNVEKYLQLKNREINRSTNTSYKKIINNFSANRVGVLFNNILSREYGVTKKSIDVVWPYYKDKAFLNNSISFINNQTLKPKNLIFVDDANNDPNLKKYIKSRLNRNIKFIYLRNKMNFGVTKSISIGVQKIKSKYLYIQSTDDIIYKNFFESNVRQIEKYPNAPYVFSDIKINNLNNKKKYFINFDFIQNSYTPSSKIGEMYDKNQFKIYHNTVLMNAQKFLKSNIFNEKFGRRADMLNLQYLSMKYGFCYLPKILSEFTIREGQISSKILDDRYLINELKVIKKEKINFYNFFTKHNLHYEISVFSMFNLSNHFNNLITFKFISRSIKFKLWKFFRFHTNPKLLNLLFRLFN
jgi:glycosyltransferase involved in cell wall biosynthesis